MPDDVPVVRVRDPGAALLDVLRQCLPDTSASELRRLIWFGAVRLNGTVTLTDPGQRNALASGDVIRVGKRQWFRLVAEHPAPSAPSATLPP